MNWIWVSWSNISNKRTLTAKKSANFNNLIGSLSNLLVLSDVDMYNFKVHLLHQYGLILLNNPLLLPNNLSIPYFIKFNSSGLCEFSLYFSRNALISFAKSRIFDFRSLHKNFQTHNFNYYFITENVSFT